ncbi:hypothetical protein, partial [Pseudomonas aeruginosa]|uniref:hypothetical protein n=1 Tax=Pseudomonas aeruginosa TaxID=287 RepID=UPI0028838624
GRGGATGRAFTLVASEDAEAIDNVEKLQGTKIPEFKLEIAEKEERKPRATERREEEPTRESRRERPARDEHKPRAEREPR